MFFKRTGRNNEIHLGTRTTTLLRAGRMLVLLPLALLALVTTAVGYDSSHQLRINRVEVDESTNQMKIIGVNFGGVEPTVTLEGNALHVVSYSASEIVVYLPAGITPGTYLLKVSIGNGTPMQNVFNVAVGAQGARGEPGPQGAQGPQGESGAQGPQGDIGPVGPRGPQGEMGATGPQGLRGETGATGAPGAQGPMGISGPAGPQGPAGADGVAGAPGAKGMNYIGAYDPAANYAVDDVVTHGGSSFIAKTANTGVEPMVGANWDLVALKGETGSSGADGDTGPAGPEGPRGPEGPPGPSLSSFDSLEGLTCRASAGRMSLVYATNGDTTLRCVLNALPPGTLPSLAINDVTRPETQVLAFTVVLSAASYQTVTVQFATEDVSAVAGSDYAGMSGTLTFLPGELTRTISVASIGDTNAEADETFRINLTNAVNANVGDAEGVGTIRNVEPSSISISNASCDETQPCEFRVTRTGDTSATVTVNYRALANGSAEGSDFASTQGTLTFNPGVTSLSIWVMTFDDGQSGGPFGGDVNETFTMILSNPSLGAIISGSGQGTGTIRP
jgi:hypothetical protein